MPADSTDLTISRPIHLLLVDDDERNYRFIRDYLDRIDGRSYQLDWVRTHEEGVAYVERVTVDVVLLDCRLGERSGIDLALYLRECEYAAPVIMLTSRPSERVDSAAMRAGVVDYLDRTELSAFQLDRSIRYALNRSRSAEAVRASQQFLLNALDALPASIAILDEEGTIIAVNGSWKRFADANGLATPDYGVGARFLDVCDAAAGPEAADAARVADAIRRAAAGEPVDFTSEYVRRGVETERWFSLSITGFRSAGAARVVVSHSEVTSRVVAERELLATVQTMQTLFASSPAAIIALDREGRVVEWNQSAERMFGWTRDEVIGKPYALVPDDEQRGWRESLERVLAGEMISGRETVRTARDGSLVPVLLSVAPIIAADGIPRGGLAVLIDLTSSAQAEEELRRRERQYRVLVENLPDVVMRYDGELQRIYSNPAAKTLMPFAGGQHYDERLDQLGISRNQLERWRGRLQRALTTGEPTTYEWSAEPEGVEVAYETRLVPEFSPDGSPESVLVVSRDISERKRREQERQFLNDASSRLAATLDFDATLKTIIELTVPRFADACSISLFDEGDAPIRRVAVVQAGENGLAEPHPAFSTHQLTPRADFGISRVYQTGEAGLYEHIDPAQLHRELETLVDAEPLREAIRTIDMRSAMFVPFKVRGRVIGALALIYGASGRHYAESDLAFAEDLANRAAIAIDNARLYHDLERSEERLRTLVEQIPAVVFTTEAADLSRPVYLSPQIEAMTGYGSEELTDGSRSWYDIIHPDDRDLVRVADASSIETGHERTLEYRLQTRAGESIWVREEARLIVDESGAPLNWQGIISDVTVQKELESQLTHQAFHDALTGLPNRALFSERVKLAQDRQARYAPNIAVCFMDLDNFKVINDSLGHAVGDMLLIQVAERLTRALRSDDTAARFGGDEFALLLEGIHNASDAVRVVTRIVAAFDEPFMVQGRELFVTPSVGVSIAGRDELDRRDLLREADAAMYKAKRSGKARFELYNPALTANLVNRLDLENDLRKTLNGEQLELEYQPLVELSSGRIVGVEALVRWRHPEHGLIPPGRFIPIAEETAMIVDLGRWILEDSCRRVQAWNLLRDGDFPLHLSVNLSARQFSDPSLVDDVRATLQRTGLRPDLLCLEITESVMMDDEEAAAGMLERLKELGVRLAVDDFGVGFSSLASLRRFPVDELKIDRSFVSGLIDDPNDSVIVSGVIGLAHALKLSVTAEGVETPEQHAQLVELSCDRAQGFAFSRPLSVETFEQDYLPGVCPNGASAAPELARGATIAAD